MTLFRRVAVVIGIALVFTSQANAQPIRVNDTADLPLVGDGRICESSRGTCTLRAAAEAAVVARRGAGYIVIEVPAGRYRLDHRDAGGSFLPIQLASGTDVRGAGMGVTIVDAGGLGRIFDCGTNRDYERRDLRLRDLTLTGGFSTGDGGAIHAPIALDGGSVELFRVELQGNRATRDGGAVASDSVKLVDSVVSDNRAGRHGGGIAELAPFASYVSRIEIRHSRIENNHAGENGGGVYGVQVNLDHTLVEANQAGLEGGGIWAQIFRSRFSTLAHNGAGNVGGGLAVLAVNDDGRFFIDPGTGPQLAIDRSTISGNVAREGGGIDVVGDGSAVLRITSTTIANNSATEGAGGLNFSEGETPLYWDNSVIADNGGGDCGGIPPTADGATHDSDDSCAAASSGPSLLAALGDFGGATPTHVPLAGSPLIDTGSVSCGDRDQREQPRPSGRCDIGSVEVRQPTPASPCQAGSIVVPGFGNLCLPQGGGPINEIDGALSFGDCLADGPGCWGDPFFFEDLRPELKGLGSPYDTKHDDAWIGADDSQGADVFLKGWIEK